MTDSIFSDDNEKASEWACAKQALSDQDGVLLKNGSKLRRTDSGLKHSFLVIDDRLLALAEKEHYLGRGGHGKAKLAEDESGRFYAVKITKKADSHYEESITRDLGLSGRKTSRESRSLKKNELLYGNSISNEDSNLVEKEYLACQYLGKTLPNCCDELNKKLSLDERYALLIKIALKLHALHTGSDSETNTPYLHTDLHEGNIVIDDQENVHIIDFGNAVTHADLLNEWGVLINKDTLKLLRHFIYSAPIYQDNSEWRGLLGDAMEGPNRNEMLLELANKGNASALEIAETLTLCRFNLEALQPEFIERTNEERLMAINVLNSELKNVLPLFENAKVSLAKQEVSQPARLTNNENTTGKKINTILLLKQLEATIEDVYFDDKYSDLKTKGRSVYRSFEALIISGDDLPEVEQCIRTTLDAVKNPTEENLTKLKQLSLASQEKSSYYWKAVGVALMAFGAALVAAGIVIIVATGGIALPVVAGLGVAAIGLFAGARVFSKGVEKEKSTSKIRDDLDSLNQEMKK